MNSVRVGNYRTTFLQTVSCLFDLLEWFENNFPQETNLLQTERSFENELNKVLPSQSMSIKTDNTKLKTKHHVLAYLIECSAKGESFPVGNKIELERIGNERMETGKGNTFYKVFNTLIRKDLNVENILIEIGGEHWRKTVIELSENPELVEKYLQIKQM